MAEMDVKAVVLDNGSGKIKAGFASEDSPRVVVPNLVGFPKFQKAMVSQKSREVYVGEDAERYKGILKLSYPIKNGKILNWDDMEKVWHAVFFNELRIAPEEQPVLLTEAPLNPAENREKMASVMFETFNVPACYIAVQAVMSLYASGKTTGIVLDSGDGVTHSVPVYEGYVTSGATGRLDLAGREVTSHLRDLLARSGREFKTTSEMEIVRRIKEKHCYFADDFAAAKVAFENSPSEFENNFELPDGQVITVGSECFEAPECMFDPTILNNEQPGCADMVNNTILAVDMDLRREMRENIVLSGGSTLIKNIEGRLKKELEERTPNNAECKILADSSRYFSVWIGASVMTSLSTFNSYWITRHEFDESGPKIVHQR